MNNKSLMLSLCVAALTLSSCATGSSVPAGVKPPEVKPKAVIYITSKTATWDTIADVKKAMAGAPVSLTGNTLDLKGCEISGKKLKRYPDIQDERNEPIRNNIQGFTLRNGIVSNSPGGIVGKADLQRYKSLTFLGIGEDALSNIMDKAEGFVVDGCKFYGATDKSIQLNDARNATVTGNYVTGGITAVRLQKTGGKTKRPKTKTVSGNTFENVRTAWNISGGVIVKASNNTYKNVGQKWVANNGASHTGE